MVLSVNFVDPSERLKRLMGLLANLKQLYMHFEEDHVYHIYNMGNNSTRIFFTKENYLFFLRKIRKDIKPISEILAYCLMPNHFHFMVQATAQSCKTNNQGMQIFSRKLGTVLSSYSQAINKQNNSSGSLFRQKTKAKDLGQYITYPKINNHYAQSCFFYIHNNPVKANLVEKAWEWQYSSFQDFYGIRKGSMCNKELAFDILGIEKENLELYINMNWGNADNIW